MRPISRYKIGRNLSTLEKNEVKIKDLKTNKKLFKLHPLQFVFIIKERNMRPISRNNIGQNLVNREKKEKNKKNEIEEKNKLVKLRPT